MLGSSKLVTSKRRDIAVFNVGGRYFAVFNRCALPAHRYAMARSSATEPGKYPLAAGRPRLRCPWRG